MIKSCTGIPRVTSPVWFIDNVTVVLTNQVHVLIGRGKEKRKKLNGRGRETKARVADGLIRASWPDSGATTDMAIMAAGEIPALVCGNTSNGKP